MAHSERGYLKPKVGDSKMLRKENNGQFANPPLMMEMGCFKKDADLKRTGLMNNMRLEEPKPGVKEAKKVI